MKRLTYARIKFIGPAETMIRNAKKALESDQQPNRDELLKLLSGFERILAGEKPSDVFGFWVSRGRPRDDENSSRDHAIAYEVIYLHQGGWLIKDALELVAERYKKSESIIKRIYQEKDRLIRGCKD